MGEQVITAKFESKALEMRLNRIADRCNNLTRPLSACGEIMLSSIDKNFEKQGRFSTVGDVRGGSTRWEPLADATKLQRIGGGKAFKKTGGIRKPAARKLAGMKILQRAGRLAASFAKKIYGNTCEVGSNVIYAAIHHHGGMAGRNRSVEIPARPILVVQDDDVAEMLDVLDTHIIN